MSETSSRNSEREPGGQAAAGERDRLRAEMHSLRASEAEARAVVWTLQQAIEDRRREVDDQVLALQREAEAGHAVLTRLAEDAWALLQAEQAADHGRAETQQRLDELLRDEAAATALSGGVKGALSLGKVRRWRRLARAYVDLIDKLRTALSEAREAGERHRAARDAWREADQSVRSAEPRASELATAVVMLRGEMAWNDETLAALPRRAGFGGGGRGVYERWVALHDTLTDGDRRAIRARLARFAEPPLISVVMPVYDPPLPFLREAVASVRRQLYPHWELCIADDASPDPAVRDTLRALAAEEPRIRLVERPRNGHISAASNSALALATGAFVALMDHDDVLAEHALFEVAAALEDDPELDLIYSDEDHIDGEGRRNTPHFKPDFNPDLMLGQNVVNHLGVYRRSLVERVGGFRPGFEGSQDYDLALRVLDAAGPGRVRHIPAVLYHWRSGAGTDTFSEASLQRCIASARRALADHLARTGQAGEVVAHPAVPSWHRVLRPRPEPAPLVSVIVPTKDRAELLGPCAHGILSGTAYPAVELLIVDHQSTEPSAVALLAELGRDPRVRVLPHAGPFNYAAINNAAVRQARGPVLALLNNDVEVMEPDWLDEMVALAVLPGVGAVGAKLLYPDGRVQHGGVVLGAGGVAGHFSHGLGAAEAGPFGRAVLTASVSAVTAACLVVRRAVFDAAGGFDAANLPVAFNDVDLCLKIRARGYRNVWTPHACLRHHESVSRGSDLEGERLARFQREAEFMQGKWGDLLDADPAYNPNLDLAAADFSPAFPPRRKKPWRTQ